MDRQFQNRLVGTIVLVALGVIFLPDLLDGKKDRVVEEFTEIPLRPVTQVHPADEESADVEQLDVEQFDVEPIAPVQDLAQSSNSVSAEEASKVSDKKQVESQSVAQKHQASSKTASSEKQQPKAVTAGYTLQLGGFNNAQNVSALLAQLRLSGYTAYTLPEKPVDGKLTRVFVGPEVNKSKLEKAQTPIYKLTGLKGKVVPFSPVQQ